MYGLVHPSSFEKVALIEKLALSNLSFFTLVSIRKVQNKNKNPKVGLLSRRIMWGRDAPPPPDVILFLNVIMIIMKEIVSLVDYFNQLIQKIKIFNKTPKKIHTIGTC